MPCLRGVAVARVAVNDKLRSWFYRKEGRRTQARQCDLRWLEDTLGIHGPLHEAYLMRTKNARGPRDNRSSTTEQRGPPTEASSDHKPDPMRITTLLTLLTPFSALAQLPLPYNTGFDNAAQQQGWQEFRTGHLSNYSWSFNSFGAPSAPNALWHDYPVEGSATDTVRDWYVSPALDLSGGASLTCKVNIYAILGSAMPADACGIWLLTGSADPELATATLLVDLLPLVTSSGTYAQLPLLSIAPTAGPARIAFYYQATQNWLTPGIDDLVITAPEVGLAETAAASPVRVYPNPGSGPLTVELSGAQAGQLARWQLFDARGARVQERSFRDRVTVERPIAAGTYTYVVSDGAGKVLARGAVDGFR